MIDPLEFQLCPDRPDCASAWSNIYQHHKGGGLMSRVFFREWQLEINAQFTICHETRGTVGGKPVTRRATDGPFHYVLGGGQRLTPTAFGERLDRELKALTIPQPEESDHGKA